MAAGTDEAATRGAEAAAVDMTAARAVTGAVEVGRRGAATVAEEEAATDDVACYHQRREHPLLFAQHATDALTWPVPPHCCIGMLVHQRFCVGGTLGFEM